MEGEEPPKQNDLKESFPYLYQKQKLRESAQRMSIASLFKNPLFTEVKQDKVELSLEKMKIDAFDGSGDSSGKNQSEQDSEREKVLTSRGDAMRILALSPDRPFESLPDQKLGQILEAKHGKKFDILQRSEFGFVEKIEEKRQMQKLGRFEAHGKILFYSQTSLGCISHKNRIRKALVWLMKWKYFNRFILLLIILNSIVLILFDYSDRDSKTYYNWVLDLIAKIITCLFLAEAAIKIVGMGFFFHKYAYLKNWWNVIDFAIVISGIIDLTPINLNLKALRILRVMRPLRTIKAIPSMRRLVGTLFTSVPELFNAGLFMMFIIMLFSIFGVQQFAGVVYYRCRLTEKPLNSTYWPKSPIHTRVCSPDGTGAFQCPKGLYCGSPLDFGISLRDDNVYNDEDMQFGIGTYDHFGQSIIAVIEAITIESWSKLMYNISDGYTTLFAQIYFCLIVIVGHYYMLQLLLAVIMQNLSKIQAQEAYDEIQRKKLQVEKDRQRQEELKLKDEEEKALELQTQKLAGDSTTPKSLGQVLKELKKQKQEQERMRQIQIEASNHLEQLRRHTNEDKDGQKQQRSANEIIKSIQKNAKDKKKLGVRFPNDLVQEIDDELKQQNIPNLKQKDTIDDQIKNTFMWNLGRSQQGNGQDMSKGIGLAMLSKLLGVQKLEDQVEKFEIQLKNTLTFNNLDVRLKVQKRIGEDLQILSNQMELDVTKKYHTSKKSVYGIDNEVQLVEQVQKSLHIMDKNKLLEESSLIQKFRTQLKLEEGIDVDPNDNTQSIKPQLSNHMRVVLRISANLKELTKQTNVKQFFFTRFKRAIIKKNLIDKIHLKVDKVITDTELIIRAQKFFLFQLCYRIQKSKYFNAISISAIFSNAIVLSLTKYPRDEDLERRLDYMNLGFFCFFFLELVIKLIGRGFRLYFKETYNWFDMVVVVISGIDIGLQYSLSSSYQNSGALTALRIFRLIRIFEIGKVWRSFVDLLRAVTKTLKDIYNISILIGIFVFTFMLIGLEVYAYRVKFNVKTNELDLQGSESSFPDSNFNTPLEALLSVFIVLANDGWTKIYFDHARSSDYVGATLFFLSILFIGQFVLLNLFIATLIENFEQLSVRNDLTNKLIRLKNIPFKQEIERILCFWNKKYKGVRPQNRENQNLTDDEYQEEERLRDLMDQKEQSLNILPYEHKLRQTLKAILTHSVFENVMLLVIIISTIQLAIDNPLDDPYSVFSQSLIKIDYSLTAIFIIEAFMKILTFGFVNCGSTSYIRNLWNVLDFSVIVITLASYAMAGSSNLSAIKAFRLLKILRPLRIISKNKGLKLSLNALAVALPSIINVLVIQILFYFIFGIIGVNYFQGRFYDCSNLSTQTYQMIDSKWDCLNHGGLWINSNMNFDDTPNAMATLFMISNTVQWSEVMYKASKIRGLDLTPSKSGITSPGAALFFVLVIIIGNFFLMNLFIGVIITAYNREKEISGQNLMLTHQQKKWVKSQVKIMQSKPKFHMKLPHSDWRQPFYYIAESKIVNFIIVLCIILNTVILALNWVGQSEEISSAFSNANYIFTAIFSAEFVIKYIGFGNRYFKDPWNTFDMVIVILTLISITFDANTSFQLGPQTTLIRSFRIARIFYLLKSNKSLKSTFMTFLTTIPAMANIGGLLLLIVFIYAVLGVNLFSKVKFNGELNEHANFQTVGNAFLTLIRITTGEKWPDIMSAVGREDDQSFRCDQVPTFEEYVANESRTLGCGNQSLAILYFFSYTVIITMVFLRLFIAIILYQFQETAEKDNKFMSSNLCEHFRNVWAEFDPDATCYIKDTAYRRFLQALGDPLGWDISYEHNFIKQQEYLSEVNLSKYNCGREYLFVDVFEHLILIMIIRREVIHYAIKNNLAHLLGGPSDLKNDFPNIENSSLNLSQVSVSNPLDRDSDSDDEVAGIPSIPVGDDNFEDLSPTRNEEYVKKLKAMKRPSQPNPIQSTTPMIFFNAIQQDSKRSRQMPNSNLPGQMSQQPVMTFKLVEEFKEGERRSTNLQEQSELDEYTRPPYSQTNSGMINQENPLNHLITKTTDKIDQKTEVGANTSFTKSVPTLIFENMKEVKQKQKKSPFAASSTKKASGRASKSKRK